MGGSPTYVWRDGARLTLWMLYVITVLDADLFRAFGVHVLVTSAIRTYAEQEAIFRARYVTAGNVNGRRVYDTRVWKGVRWYRISSAGTVAAPGFSNHEIQGDKAAVDIRDTCSDAGITVASSRRGRWIREWCRSKGLMIASGDGFREGWHFDVPGIFRTPPALPDPDPIKENDMSMQIFKAKDRDPRLFIDEMGVDNIGDFKTGDISNAELIAITGKVFGEHVELSPRELDVAKAVAARRWEAKKQEIVDAVVAALKPGS